MLPSCSLVTSFSEIRHLGHHHWSALLPGLARPPKKGRCRQVKPLVSKNAGVGASALSGVQLAEWREQGHYTTSPDTQERSFARGQDKTSIASKQVLLAVWAAKRGIDCVSNSRDVAAAVLRPLRSEVSIAAAADDEKPHPEPSAAQAARTLLPRRGDHGQERN